MNELISSIVDQFVVNVYHICHKQCDHMPQNILLDLGHVEENNGNQEKEVHIKVKGFKEWPENKVQMF